MGAGKSYTGKLLAKLLRVPFIDLDERIESAAGKTISAIFAEDGEEVFREYERQALRACAQLDGGVIATGGGAPCFHDGMDWMNDQGLTVFLDPTLEILFARLASGRSHRPLLEQEQAFQKAAASKLAARRPTYEKAQLQLRITDPNADVARYLHDFITGVGPNNL